MKVLFSVAGLSLALLMSHTHAADAIPTVVAQPVESLSLQFTPSEEEMCWIRQLQMASDHTTSAQIVELCHQEAQQHLQDASQPDTSTLPNPDQNTPATQTELKKTSLLVDRLTRESFADNNPHAITSHKLNYLLPISYVEGLNAAPFELAGDNADFDNKEAKFQFSIKAALAKSLLFDNDKLYFAFTTLSFWQVYDRGNLLANPISGNVIF